MLFIFGLTRLFQAPRASELARGMHLMFYMTSEGKRVYTLKVSGSSCCL